VSWHEILVWQIVGLVAGWLASLIPGGRGIIRHLIAGLPGSLVGGFLFSHFGWQVPISNERDRRNRHLHRGAIIVIAIARAVA